MNHISRPQKINFNESLLLHSLTKSQTFSSNRSFHKKSCSSLLSQLNMTYSRLTLETKHDHVKQNLSIQDEIQYDFEKENQPLQQQIYPQKKMCSNCESMKNQLVQVQLFLLQIEKKFIEKQLLLSDKYKSITDQLYQKNQQLIQCQNLFNRLEQKISFLNDVQNLPKLQLNTITKPFNETYFPSSTSKNCLNTLSGTNASQNSRIIRSALKQNTCLSKCQQTDKQNQPLRKITQPGESIKKSMKSSVDLSYTESERQISLTSDPFQHEKYSTSDLTFTNSKNKNTLPDENFKTKRYYELSKLRFQNSSLKSYNSVLLQHVKPRNLAQKIFALRKN